MNLIDNIEFGISIFLMTLFAIPYNILSEIGLDDSNTTLFLIFLFWVFIVILLHCCILIIKLYLTTFCNKSKDRHSNKKIRLIYLKREILKFSIGIVMILFVSIVLINYNLNHLDNSRSFFIQPT
jgi:hypothetical protein